MNREMRRLAEREERRSKQKDTRGRRSPIVGGSGGQAGQPRGRWARLVQFLREVRVELSRVGWPSRQQMVAFTAVTVVTAGVLTGYVFVVDLAFSRTVLALIRELTG
ncbi:MAG: preprotein translocase subunit SecE [bacterium]|nr:preprotein translocase subunit SecE [bacterium]MDE0289007.1 preprotein translocase subunit SecE [bacterium]MDE0438125.1 preprotein translocase subunit SecE [bacterium]